MADKSKIEWTDATWNPIRGCSRVSEGCRNCYAERTAARFAGPGQPYEGLAISATASRAAQWTGDVRFIPELLDQPLHWRRPRKIFVNSMSDLFHEKIKPEWVIQIFAVMALCPHHAFQILTKRPEVMRTYLQGNLAGNSVLGKAWMMLGRYPKHQHAKLAERPWPLPNVWLGVSVEGQKTADERIPLLLSTPAAVRWVSYEPALGPVDFNNLPSASGIGRYLDSLSNAGVDPGALIPNKLDWIVAGGESGPGARPANPEWFRGVRDQCVAAGVPFFFKQWGEWLHLSQVPAVLTEREREIMTFRGMRQAYPKTLGIEYLRIGKKRAGALLDGMVYREFPR